jgi:hypothetical protein
MTYTEVFSQVANLNGILQGKPWLDIDVVDCSPQAVVLACGIDLSVGPDIEIRFDSVFLACLLMTWKTDTSSPVLQILTNEEAMQTNRLYCVEQGHHLFAFQPEDRGREARCLIAAKSLSWQAISRT